MRLSCRARYATRALIDLAQRHNKEPVSLATIAQNECISKKYLNQLMGPLKLAGLVRVVRGKKGGFSLSKSPSEITLGDILHAVEGDMTLTDCVSESRVCERSETCPSRVAWEELSTIINDYLRNTTLEDLMAEGSEQ